MTKNKILLEATVRDAYKINYTYPPSESVELEYDLDPKDYCDVFDTSFDEDTGEIRKEFREKVTTGWMGINLPEYYGLNVGDKIQILKIEK